MPHVNRRRVPGLRRQEVAELIGVSEDWYRWFESGRPVSVSPKFLARLCDVFQLNAPDRVMLYHLALSELYRADVEAGLELPKAMASNVAPVSLPGEIDEARRRFDAAREAFLSNAPTDLSVLRRRIVESWNRSASIAVRAELLAAPLAIPTDDGLAEARDENRALLGAAMPVLARLEPGVEGSRYCVALTDALGRVLYLSGDRAARRLVERAGIVLGADLNETAVGTNGVGTVIADARPLQIMASEHFVEGGQPLSCTGSPIRDASNALCGVLVLMGDYRLVRPALLPWVVRNALEIEEQIARPVPT